MRCKLCDFENQQVHYELKNASVHKCKKCNFHYSNFLDDEYQSKSINPNDTLDENTKKYIKYQLQNNKQRFLKQVEISQLQLKHIEQPKILDVGVGGGLYLSMMAAYNSECYGIELDMQRAQFAQEEYGLKHIFSMPIQDNYWVKHHKNSFDLITLWDVIEHVNAPKEIFITAHNLLKPGGFLIMDTPCRDTFYHKFGQISYLLSGGKFPTFLNIMYSNRPFGHKQILSKNDVEQLCAGSKYDLIDLEIFHELSFPIKFYLNKMFKNQLLVNNLTPITKAFFRLARIRNKMLFIAQKL